MWGSDINVQFLLDSEAPGPYCIHVKFPSWTFSFPFLPPNFLPHLWGLKSLILTLALFWLLHTLKSSFSPSNNSTQNLSKWSCQLHCLSRANQQLHIKTGTSQTHLENFIRQPFPPSHFRVNQPHPSAHLQRCNWRNSQFQTHWFHLPLKLGQTHSIQDVVHRMIPNHTGSLCFGGTIG